MKIVDRSTFLSLPAYTVYSKLNGICFGEIRIKFDSWGSNGDYRDMPLIEISENSNELEMTDISAIYFREIERSKEDFSYSIKMETEVISRDGLYKADQLFCVFEKKDVKMIISVLNKCFDNLK